MELLDIFERCRVKEEHQGINSEIPFPRKMGPWLLGGIMKQVNIYNFYQFGSLLHPITQLREGKPFREYFYTLYVGKLWLESFVRGELIPMTICTPVARKVIGHISILIPKDKKETPFLDMDDEVNFATLYPIVEGIKEFETVLAAELQNLATYFVSKKSIYETNDLIQKAEEWFPESIREKFTGQVVLDLREAGKCLAFDLSTASGFHIARAVEGVLLEYLKVLCPDKVETMKDSDRNLGRFIRMARENGGEEKVCSSLDQFRDLHRNPLIHPETVLTMEEAITLHGIAQSSIVSIILAIERRDNPTLALPI